MMIREVEGRITALGITAQFDPSVAQMLASCESVKTYGARPLRREISSKIEDAFSLWMLDGKIREGDHVLLFAVDGKIEYLKLETGKKRGIASLFVRLRFACENRIAFMLSK